MRIVVTGATGNVGSQLLPQLLDSPEVSSVVGLARRLPTSPDPRAEWHQLDVAEGDLVPVFRGADVVVHLAWLLQPAHDPDEMRRVNVQGSRAVFAAVAEAGVPALVHASSVGAYSPGPPKTALGASPRVTEDHPTGGISTSTYSRHKSEVERMLDGFEAEHPERRVVRMRPGVVLQAAAASELARYFLGPFVPQSLVRRGCCPSCRTSTASPSRSCTPRTWPARTSSRAPRRSPVRSTSRPSRCSTRRRSAASWVPARCPSPRRSPAPSST
jgi:nucleoside-diphosphate-sugar epimerase